MKRTLRKRIHTKVLLVSIVLVFISCCRFAYGEEEDYLNHPDRTEWIAGGFYEGLFQDGTPFQMNLPYPIPKSINRKEQGPSMLRASYWYPRKFIGAVIFLKAKSITDNGFNIATESHIKSAISEGEEIFEGKFSPDKKSAQGFWTQTKRKKRMAFTMKRVFEYKAIDVALPIHEEDYNSDRPFVFGAVFPIFGDSSINHWIKNLLSVCEHDLECSNSVEIEWYSKANLSLNASVWGYSKGLAHGNGFTAHRNYMSTSAGFKQVSIGHFVNTSENCLKRLSREIVASLKKQKYSRAEGPLCQYK